MPAAARPAVVRGRGALLTLLCLGGARVHVVVSARKEKTTVSHACACSSVCENTATLADPSACFDPIARCVPRVRWYTPPRDDGRPADALNYSLALLDWNTVYRISDLARARGQRFRLDSMIILCEPRYRGTLLRDALVEVSRLNGSVALSTLDDAAIEATVGASTEGEPGVRGQVRLLGKSGPNGIAMLHGLMPKALVRRMQERLRSGRCEVAPADAVVVYARLGDAVGANYVDPLLERLDLELEWLKRAAAGGAEAEARTSRSGRRKRAVARAARAVAVREVVISGVLNYATNPLNVLANDRPAYAHEPHKDRLSADVVDRIVAHVRSRGLRASVRSEPDADRDLCYYVLSPHVVTGVHGGFPLFVQMLRGLAFPCHSRSCRPSWDGVRLASLLPKHACACADACPEWESGPYKRCIDPLRKCGKHGYRWLVAHEGDAAASYRVPIVSQQGSYRLAEIALSRGPKWRLDALRVLCGRQYRKTVLREALVNTSTLDGEPIGGLELSRYELRTEEQAARAPPTLEAVLGNRTEGPTRWPGHALLTGHKGASGVALRPRELPRAIAQLLAERLGAGKCEIAPADALVVYVPVGADLGADPAAIIKNIDLVLAEMAKEGARARRLVLAVRMALPAAAAANVTVEPGGAFANAHSLRREGAVEAVDALLAHARSRGLRPSVYAEPDVDRLLCYTTFAPVLVTADVTDEAGATGEGKRVQIAPKIRRQYGDDVAGVQTEQLFTELLWRLRRSSELLGGIPALRAPPQLRHAAQT